MQEQYECTVLVKGGECGDERDELCDMSLGEMQREDGVWALLSPVLFMVMGHEKG